MKNNLNKDYHQRGSLTMIAFFSILIFSLYGILLYARSASAYNRQTQSIEKIQKTYEQDVPNATIIAEQLEENNDETEQIHEDVPSTLSKIKSWTSASNTDFHKDSIKNSITEIEFVNYIPNPIQLNDNNCWDVSEKEGDKTIIAWLNGTKLYIGGNGGVMANVDSACIFRNFANLKSISFNNNYITNNVEDMHAMFSGCSSLQSLDLSKFNTDKVDNMYAMFYKCHKLTSLNLSSFNTSKVTNMQSMFNMSVSDVSNLESIIFGNKWNTSNVTNMKYLFDKCSKLNNIDLSKFNTSKVKYMQSMFSGCSRLSSLDLSTFNTSKAEDMQSMFAGCTNLLSLNLSNFNTSNVTNMNYMFRGCTSLTTLNLSNFDTSNVTKIRGMFDGNRTYMSLKTLDLSGKFNTKNVEDAMYMFHWCNQLTTVYVGDNWDLTNATSASNMFYENNQLVGGNGTSFNSSNISNTYARIDKPGEPGYLTYKPTI